MQYVKEQYKEWKQEKSQTITFEDNAITIDLPDSPPIIVNDWSIVPLTPTQVIVFDYLSTMANTYTSFVFTDYQSRGWSV